MIIDIIAGLLLAYGFYTGFSRGLIKTVFDTLSLIIGIVAALKISPLVISFLQGIIPLNKSLVFVIGFVLTFLIIMGLIRFIGNKLESVLETANINIINKLLGGVLMSVFYAVLLSYLVWGVNKLQLLNPELKDASMSYPMLEKLPEQSKSVAMAVKPVFSDFWEKMMDTMDDIKDAGDNVIPASENESR